MNYDYTAEEYIIRRDEIYGDIYHRMLNKPHSKITLPKIKPTMYKTALLDFMKFGKVTRYPTKHIETWKEIIINNTIMLDVTNELYGHNNYFDVDLFNDYVLNSDETGKNVRDWSEAMEYLETNGLDDVLEHIIPKFSNGHYLISDYGLKSLLEICYELMETDDHNQILVLINRALDVSHQRSDLSELFIEGGYNSLEWISNLSESLIMLIHDEIVRYL